MTRVLAFAAMACFLIVVLTHVAERGQLLPAMGWGLPNSPGHYLDLTGAVCGVAFSLAALARWLWRR
jgi:hypothetical protein